MAYEIFNISTTNDKYLQQKHLFVQVIMRTAVNKIHIANIIETQKNH